MCRRQRLRADRTRSPAETHRLGAGASCAPHRAPGEIAFFSTTSKKENVVVEHLHDETQSYCTRRWRDPQGWGCAWGGGRRRYLRTLEPMASRRIKPVSVGRISHQNGFRHATQAVGIPRLTSSSPAWMRYASAPQGCARQLRAGAVLLDARHVAPPHGRRGRLARHSLSPWVRPPLRATPASATSHASASTASRPTRWP